MQETLRQKQSRFARMVVDLLERATELSYEYTLGEAYRPPETAALYAKQGKGIARSLHCDRLAIDICLFKDGLYLTKSEQYKELGEAWEEMGGAWGGRFGRPDGNHFSLAHGGRK